MSVAKKEEKMTEDLNEIKEKTRKTAELYFGGIPRDERAFDVWKSFDKDLAKEISMHFTGKLYAREKISHKTRQLVTVSALTAMGMGRELWVHIWAALKVGCTREEIAEVIFQMHTYVGVPRMHNGLSILRDVLEKWKEVYGDTED